MESKDPAVSLQPGRSPAGFPLDKIPAADIRDWTEINDWATGIARQIKPAA